MTIKRSNAYKNALLKLVLGHVKMNLKGVRIDCLLNETHQKLNNGYVSVKKLPKMR